MNVVFLQINEDERFIFMKRRRLAGKRFMGMLLSLCLAGSGAIAHVQAQEKDNESLLVHYDFSGLSGEIAERTAF